MNFKHTIYAGLSFIVFAACSGPTEQKGNLSETDSAVVNSNIIALVANRGEYVSCELEEGNRNKELLVANRTTVGDWEKFEIVDIAEGKIALLAANGKYVSADMDRNNLLVADRHAIGDWETFVLTQEEDGLYSLKSSTGKYVAVEYGSPDSTSKRLVANRETVGDWEKFSLLRNQ